MLKTTNTTVPNGCKCWKNSYFSLFWAKDTTAEFGTVWFPCKFRDVTILQKKQQHGYFIQQVFYNIISTLTFWYSHLFSSNPYPFSVLPTQLTCFGVGFFFKWNIFLQRWSKFGSIMSIHCTSDFAKMYSIFMKVYICFFSLCVFSMQYIECFTVKSA